MFRRISKEKLIIILTVLVDVIGIGIIIPVMPYFVKNLGASPVIVTTLFAVFSLFSFFSAPFLGAWSDKYGRRPALIISLASTAIGWFVFGAAGGALLLFVGRIIDGLAAGNFPIAQSYLVDIAKTQKERTSNLGLIGAVFGVGFIIGPALGALLSHISLSFPFYFVGGLAALNTLAAYFFLPETNANLKRDKKISLNPFAPLITAAQDKVLRSRYLVLLLFGLAVAVQQSIFALFMESAFGLSLASAGYIYAFVGLLMVINQAWLLNNFWLKKYTEKQLEVWIFLLFALSYFVIAVPNFIIFAFGLVVMTFSQAVLRAVVSSRITGFSHPHKKGEVAGIMSSIMTVGMVIGPLSVGTIYAFNIHLPFIVSGIILLAAFFVMYFWASRIPEKTFHHEDCEPVEVL